MRGLNYRRAFLGHPPGHKKIAKAHKFNALSQIILDKYLPFRKELDEARTQGQDEFSIWHTHADAYMMRVEGTLRQRPDSDAPYIQLDHCQVKVDRRDQMSAKVLINDAVSCCVQFKWTGPWAIALRKVGV